MDSSILRIAENATILRRICDKPIPLTPNNLNVLYDDTGRTLPLKDELDIVNCLTYLSSYSDHPGDVMGMCLEEVPDKKSLVISIATNNGPSLYLEKFVRDIADKLERQDDGESLYPQQ
jgi:hypothetical protein